MTEARIVGDRCHGYGVVPVAMGTAGAGSDDGDARGTRLTAIEIARPASAMPAAPWQESQSSVRGDATLSS